MDKIVSHPPFNESRPEWEIAGKEKRARSPQATDSALINYRHKDVPTGSYWLLCRLRKRGISGVDAPSSLAATPLSAPRVRPAMRSNNVPPDATRGAG